MKAKISLNCFVAMAGILLFAHSAEASHWRFGHVTWQRVSGNTVDITVTEGYRSSFIGSNSYAFGDGSGSFSSAPGRITLASGVDIAGEGFTILRNVTRHTYSNEGPFTVSFQSCCRIGSIINPSSGQRMEAVVDLRNGNQGSPVSSIPVILQMVQGGVNTIPIAIADPDGDPFTCRMATSGESLINGVATGGGNTLSVSNNCVLTWDTTGTTIGQKYAVQVAILENIPTPPPSAPPAADTPTALRFIVSNAQCSGAPPTFTFGVNGTTIGTSVPNNGCFCNANPLVVTFTSPSVLGLLTSGVGQDVLTMTINGNPNVGFVRAEVDRSATGTETLCLLGGCNTANVCADRPLCNGCFNNGNLTFSSVAGSAAGAPDGRVALDFIIEIVGGTIQNPNPPTCTLNGTVNNVVQVGQAFSISMTGDDADGGTLTLSDFGLPTGATLSPASGTASAAPFTTTFSWTPTAADAGSAQSVTVTFTDPGGLQSTCSFAIQVPSNQPPVPVCQNATVSANAGCLGVVTTADVDAGSFDPDGDPITFTLMPAGPYPLGNTSVMLDVDDGTEARCCSALVTVLDTTPPVLAVPVDLSIECDQLTDPSVTGQASATDNCDSAPTVSFVDSVAAGTCPQESLITRTWTGADNPVGNATTGDQFITVVDTTAPTLTCPGDIAISAGFGGTGVTYQTTAIDACDPNPTITNTPPSGSLFPTGVTTVTATASDACTNAAAPCAFNVAVSCFGVNRAKIGTKQARCEGIALIEFTSFASDGTELISLFVGDDANANANANGNTNANGNDDTDAALTSNTVVDDGVNGPQTVHTSCSQPINIGDVFGAYTVTDLVKIFDGNPEARGNEIELRGSFNPAVAFNPATDEVAFSIDDGAGNVLAFLIPPASFSVDSDPEKQKFKFEGMDGAAELKVKFEGCKFKFKAKGVVGAAQMVGTTMTVGLQVGTQNVAQETITMVDKSNHLKFKRKPKVECCPECEGIASMQVTSGHGVFVFEPPAGQTKLPSNTVVDDNVSGAMTFHTSCSQPINVGDVVGPYTISELVKIYEHGGS